MEFSAGMRVGRYRLTEPLDNRAVRGVWKAVDTRLEHTVAMRFSDQPFSNRFHREAHALATLDHPHIATLFDVGPDFLVMEYVEGTPVRGPMAIRPALQYAIQIASALQAAHARGIVHGGLHPNNILITGAGIKLIDFGLADRIAGETADPSGLAYRAPEQMEGRAADARSDIFALGKVLRELTGGDVPPPLDRLIRKCVAQNPGARWQTATDLRDELEWIAQSGAAPKPAAVPVPAAPPPQPSRSFTEHLREPALALIALLTMLCFALAWIVFRAEPPAKWSAVRLGGPPVAFFPRVSPDGKAMAFETLVDGNVQLGEMRRDSNSWLLLTGQKGLGYIDNISWSRDNSTIYFDRYWDSAQGVYSVPAEGGTLPTLVLAHAFAPQVVGDGSLVVAQATAAGGFQLYHYSPDTGRSDPLPAFFDPPMAWPEARVFPDGRELVFYGYTGAGHAEPRKMYLCDLARRTARPFGEGLAPWPAARRPLAIASDGRSVVTLAEQEDLLQAIRIPRNGKGLPEVLFSFPKLVAPMGMDAGPDGSIYLDSVMRAKQGLIFRASGGIPQTTAIGDLGQPAILPAGDRFVYSALTAGRPGLAAGTFGGNPRPLLQTSDESSGPLALFGEQSIAFVIGRPGDRQIAVAALDDGRISRRIPARVPNDIASLAASPDGGSVYYAADGAIWSLPVQGEAVPRRIAAGDSVAVDPSGKFLYIKQPAKNGAVLVRVPAEGGDPETVLGADELHLAPQPLGANSVDAAGHMVVETVAPDSFFFRPVVVDVTHRTVTPIPLAFSGDTWSPLWNADGSILAAGTGFESSLWRYRKQ